ncbi:MAG: hypothetical protein ACOYOV_06345 [Bacteroidales bacterium]
MSRETFNRIKEFSTARNLTKLQERILLHRYFEDYYFLIDDYARKHQGNNPSADTIVGFNTTLLSDMTLSTNVNLSAAELEEFNKKEIEKVKAVNGWKNFGLSTLSSIIGSFLFTLLIIILFLMGESQIKSWINDFGKKSTETTQGQK